MTGGWRSACRCGAAHRKPQLRGEQAHLWRFAVNQSTPSEARSIGSIPGCVRRVDQHRDAGVAADARQFRDRKDQRAL